MKNKRGRKPYPVEMRAKNTSLRLRPDRLNLFKDLGGVKWLNVILDTILFERKYQENFEAKE